jgi:hypothetical protein
MIDKCFTPAKPSLPPATRFPTASNAHMRSQYMPLTARESTKNIDFQSSVANELRNQEEHIASVLDQLSIFTLKGKYLDNCITDLARSNSEMDNQIKSLRKLQCPEPIVAKQALEIYESKTIKANIVSGSIKYYKIASKLRYSPLKISSSVIRCAKWRRKIRILYF